MIDFVIQYEDPDDDTVDVVDISSYDESGAKTIFQQTYPKYIFQAIWSKSQEAA